MDRGELAVLALLLPAGFFARRRKIARPLLLMVAIVSLAGCSAGRQIPDGGLTGAATPTPSGTYTLHVSATSAGITRDIGLTLIVQ